jgi:DNA polymerase-3 subunit delta
MKTDTEIYPVYLLYGTEEFLLEEEIQRLLDRTLSQKERGLNLHLFRGDEHSGQEIVQTAQTLPMFSRYRFVLVRDADQVDTEKRDVLLNYIQNSSATTCLVLCAPTLGPWKGHQSLIEKVGKVAGIPEESQSSGLLDATPDGGERKEAHGRGCRLPDGDGRG